MVRQAGKTFETENVRRTQVLLQQSVGACSGPPILKHPGSASVSWRVGVVPGVPTGSSWGGLHYRGAMAMIVLVRLHLLRVFVSGRSSP
jgi:hypothetical protein